MRFYKKGKLMSRLVRLFEVLKHVGKVAYQLAFPTSMDCIHNMFHVQLLHKYINDSIHVLRVEEVELEDNLMYKELPI